MLLLLAAGLLCPAPAAAVDMSNLQDRSTWNAVPPTWHVDLHLYPHALGVLSNGRLMHPVDMSDWPVRIDGARQLFLDDYLIAAKKGVSREVHSVRKHPGNPLIVPDKPWEANAVQLPTVRYDRRTGLFRMWYASGVWLKLPSGKRARWPACYAESKDGLTWTKPNLRLFEYKGSKDNNLINLAGYLRSLVIRQDDPDPASRYKAIFWHEPPYVRREGYFLYTSGDGIRWKRIRKRPVLPMGIRSQRFPTRGIGDSVYVKWDPRLKKYIASAKIILRTVPRKGLLDVDSLRRRTWGFLESDDLIHWSRPRMALYPDALDGPDAEIYRHATFAYESTWIGFLGLMQTRRRGRKTTEVALTTSRDGRHWSRVANREAFIPLGGEKDWDSD